MKAPYDALEEVGGLGQIESQARQILQNMQFGLLVYRLEDFGDDRTLRLTTANAGACELLSLSRETAIGRYIDEIFPGLREAGLPNLFADVARTQQAVRRTSFRYEDSRLDSSVWSFQAFPISDDCVAVTFENVNRQVDAERDTRRQLRRLAALHAIDLAILGSLDLRLTLQVFLDQLTNQLNIDAAGVLLFDDESEFLEGAACRGFRNPEVYGPRIRPDEGLPGRVAVSHRPVEIPDLSAEPSFRRGEELRAEGFLAYCGVPLIAKGKLRGILEVFHRSPLKANADWRDFLQTLAAQAAIAIDNAVLLERLQCSNRELTQAYEHTLEGWARALELRDWETEGHARRVTLMCVELAQELGIKGAELVQVRRGALLHDVGKIGIPDEILRKPGPLTAEEWIVMRRHPQLGYNLLKPIPFLDKALDIPLYHHEWWNGKGYPHGLSGDTIPLAARIFAVVDAWDAMRSDRPYRKALSVEDALDQIRSNSGSQFDPQIVEVFLKSELYFRVEPGIQP
jgi:hypothetical protein